MTHDSSSTADYKSSAGILNFYWWYIPTILDQLAGGIQAGSEGGLQGENQ